MDLLRRTLREIPQNTNSLVCYSNLGSVWNLFRILHDRPQAVLIKIYTQQNNTGINTVYPYTKPYTYTLKELKCLSIFFQQPG